MLALTTVVCVVPASAWNVGDTIEFGTYPQTKVSETAALRNTANAATWASYYYAADGAYIDANPGDPGTQEPQPDPNMCHWCGQVHEGFFQKIIGFFHNILAKIFGNKF